MRSLLRFGALLTVIVCASPASATDVFEFPDTGTEPLSRAGAWVARATNPLAVIHNPAGLADQQTGALANAHQVFNDVCFTRTGQGVEVETHQAPYRPDACDETAAAGADDGCAFFNSGYGEVDDVDLDCRRVRVSARNSRDEALGFRCCGP